MTDQGNSGGRSQTEAVKPSSQSLFGIRLLRNPWFTFLAIVAGVTCGLEVRWLVPYVAPVGRLYLSLFQMCVLPIIACAIIVNFARLLRSGLVAERVGRILRLFAVTALLGAVIGCLIGVMACPGAGLSASARATLGHVFVTSSVDVSGGAKTHAVWGLLNTLVPSNIFFALSAGQTLAVIFVSILLGFSLGVIKESSSRGLMSGFSGAHDAFVRILDWTLYGLPIGLFCLLAEQVNLLGVEILAALAKLVAWYYGGCVVLCLLYLVNLRITTGLSFSGILKGLGQPLTVALVTQSSIAALPLALERMKSKFRQPEDATGFVLPLGVVANRHSYVLLFALTAVFVSQLYSVPLGPAQIVTLVVTATVSGMAAVGAPSVVAPMIAYVLAPIGLPAAAGIAVVVAIGPLVDPMASMSNLFGSCATTTLINSGDRSAPENAAVAAPAAVAGRQA